MRLPAWTGWGYSKDFPRPAGKSFRAMWGKRKTVISNLVIGNSANPKAESPFPITTPQLPITNYQSQFVSELTALGGTVIPCTATNLSAKLTDFLRQREANSVFVDDVGATLAVALPPEIEIVREPDPTVKFGLTGCAGGIANTGTVLLLDAGETLKASLLPETHLVVLPASLLVADLPEALPAARNASNAVLVTGPSRTADIEMTLTIGVHGPKEIIVFLVDDSKSG